MTAAVTVTVLIIGIIPHTNPHAVDTGLGKQPEETFLIQLVPLEILINHAAFNLRQIGGNVHTADKIITHTRNRCHIDIGSLCNASLKADRLCCFCAFTC